MGLPGWSGVGWGGWVGVGVKMGVGGGGRAGQEAHAQPSTLPVQGYDPATSHVDSMCAPRCAGLRLHPPTHAAVPPTPRQPPPPHRCTKPRGNHLAAHPTTPTPPHPPNPKTPKPQNPMRQTKDFIVRI